MIKEIFCFQEINLAEVNQSRETCRQALLSSDVYLACNPLVGASLDFESRLDDCVTDLLVSGDTSWTLTAVDSLQFTCFYTLTTNYTLWVGGVPPLTQLGSLCPNNCSQQGTCNNGKIWLIIC